MVVFKRYETKTSVADNEVFLNWSMGNLQRKLHIQTVKVGLLELSGSVDIEGHITVAVTYHIVIKHDVTLNCKNHTKATPNPAFPYQVQEGEGAAAG